MTLAGRGGKWFTDDMPVTRRRFLAASASGAWLGALRGWAQEGSPARLGLLLDTSAEMGFLVPQARKELAILNEQLTTAGRPTVVMREIAGASVDREGPSSLAARRNVLYALKPLYSEVDTVLWITSLRGDQSPHGLLAIGELLRETVPGRPGRRLVIRNIWQDQLLAGDAWVQRPPSLETDPLDLRIRPEEWYRLLAEGHGVIQRSWQVPPPDFRSAFAFPHRIAGSSYLKKLGQEGREAHFDQSWAQELARRHELHFVREKEEWPVRLTGRRWLTESTLLPFPDEAARAARSGEVLEALCARESIAEDLGRIEAEKLGVIFGLGYVTQDLKRQQANRGRPLRTWLDHYLADLVRVGAECAGEIPEEGGNPARLHAMERIELASKQTKPASPDPIARRLAWMAREKRCDAVYLFTNGYLGGGEYGTWSLDLNLLALAIRESGTRLFVRIPFEFGPVPLDLVRLAMASGGGVFCGRADDPDWRISLPSPTWPEAVPMP